MCQRVNSMPTDTASPPLAMHIGRTATCPQMFMRAPFKIRKTQKQTSPAIRASRPHPLPYNTPLLFLSPTSKTRAIYDCSTSLFFFARFIMSLSHTGKYKATSFGCFTSYWGSRTSPTATPLPRVVTFAFFLFHTIK